MFDIVRNNRRLVQWFLVLITLPFAFWGVDSYVRNDGGGEAASVGGSKINPQEFQQALREQQQRLRPALGGNVDPAMLDNPEIRRAVLEGLVSQRLLAMHANEARLTISNDQLKQFIASAPTLQENGKYSPRRYDELVASQNLSKDAFEARVRQDLAMQQALLAVSAGALPGRVATERWLAAQIEEREIAEAVLAPDGYVAQVKLAADAVKNYYDANRKQFEVPEQVRAEYLVLSLDALLGDVKPSPEDVRKAYDAAAKDYDEAKRKAMAVLADVRKEPKKFADLARRNSQDPGSKDSGGDLGFFGRGMMVKPFEEAVFKMKPGEISGLVESDFGFHIIQLTDVRKGSAGEERQASHILIAKTTGSKSFEAARPEIESRLKREIASKKYAETAEGFSNMVYEQSDSLQPVADKYKLNVQRSEWIVRGGQALPPFANPKLAAALFADDAVKNKRNTEAVEVAPNTLVSARVVEHKPATLQPLESVAGAIEKLLVRQEAARLAAADGAAKLARLDKGEKIDLAWSTPRTVARSYAPNLAPDAVRAVFAADAAKLPAYAGAAVPGGYALYRISQVRPYAPAAGEEPARVKALRQQYARIVAEEELSAWLTTLRDRFPVEINRAALETKER